MKGLVPKLKQVPLLWVHSACLGWRNPKNGIVEQCHRGDEGSVQCSI